MNSEDRIAFPDIEPPLGGTERFRMQLEITGDDLHATFGRWAAAGGVVAVLAIAAIAVLRPAEVAEPQEDAVAFDAPEFDRLLGRPMQQVETTVMIGEEPAILAPLPVTRPGIRIYEIRPN